MRKKSLILISFLALSACDVCEPVSCHAWSRREINELRIEDQDLPEDATLHALIKNYEAVCIQ